jgi:hypothetical protein
MGATRRHRWLCAVLLAPLAVLAVTASSFSALRCTMSGLLIPEACCPPVANAAPTGEAPRQPSVEPPGCCERVVVTNAKAPALTADRADAISAGPVALVVASHPAVAPLTAERPRRDSVLRPPGRSAPAFLLTHAFLI